MGSRALAACQGEDMISCSSRVKSSSFCVRVLERPLFAATGVGAGAEGEGVACTTGIEDMFV